MFAAPGAKEEIALTARSVQLRSRHRKFSLVSAVRVAAITATARISRLCAPLTGQPWQVAQGSSFPLARP
jgi:hypothetical protein